MDAKENYLRTLEFRNPQWIQFGIVFSWGVWHKYREDLVELLSRHPKIFKDRKIGPFRHYIEPTIPEDFDADPPRGMRKGEYVTDNWGCVRHGGYQGLGGSPVDSKAPLADWEALDTYQPPDPLKQNDYVGQRDWDKIKRDIEDKRKKGLLTRGDGGDLFTRLYWLRGFNNLMMDIATDDPHLPQLIDMLTEYQVKLVQKWLSIGVDIISFHTDIGTQDRLMISPDKFRQWIKPMYQQIFLPVRNAGVHVALSSDGRLVEIVDDLVECGVSTHGPQVGASTLAEIEKFYKGKICIGLDLNRQMFAFCRPSDIKEQVKEGAERLSSPEGGLTMSCDVIDANTPLENIEAMCQAGEEYCLANKPE